jgi:nitrite reductase (NADH) small subunit
MRSNEMNWQQIGHIDDIPRQGSRVVQTSSGEIALFRSVDDQVFALNNRCPHKGGPLSQGIVHGKRVTCPLHNWVVAPDEGCAHRHEVRVAHGVVFLEVKAGACIAT